MSQTIDRRIVEMRFDNKEFEAGAKQTMSTLGRLKEALKLSDAGKGLEGIDKATKSISLDGIAAGVEALQNRFSTFGIVGMRVIENITDGLMNKLHAAVNAVTDSIVSGGIKRAMNIENAHFQLQALLKDEAKVQAVMADAMEAVDGTAYAYDEAAKAASQFAASGVQAGEDMLGALKGITGVAAMTNSSFEDISRIFTTVAGNGRLMGDQLLQLSSRGLNAASTLADYFREVRGQSNITEADIRKMVTKSQISFKDFSEAMTWAFGDSAKRANETFTGALSNMKSALARIGAGFVSPLVEQNGEIVKLFNALRIKINDVKSALVFDEQRSAIAGLAEVTKMSNDELSDMFDTIKKNGSVSIENLDTLSKKGANAYGALTKYVNGVTDGSIRASYAITTALNDLTNGTRVSTSDIRRFVEEGKIDLATFTSAMESEFGTEKTLSKQFTDWFLDHIHAIVDTINSLDMTKPMDVFYHWVEIVKNLVKGLLSFITPIGKAFSDSFLSFGIDDVISFSSAVEELTSKMKLSEKGSQNLHDAFKGVFDVAKLLVDVFFNLLGLIIPINKPIVEMGGGFLSLAGGVGRTLTKFTEMIRSCELLRSAFSGISRGFSFAMDLIAGLIKIIKNLISGISELEGTTKLINAITSAFKKLGTKASPYIESFINWVDSLFTSMFHLEDINLDTILNAISNTLSDLAWEIEHLSFETIERAIDAFKKKVKELASLAMSNEGFATFVTNFKKYCEELKEAFTLDNLLSRIERVMEVFGKFFNWIKNVMGPAFKDFNFGSAVAAGGGLGIIYAMIKAAKSFETISKSLGSFASLFGSVKSTLVAYQKELKAEALLKIAAAIAVLAGALVLLSFADTDRLLDASIALSLIAGVLLFGVSKLLDATNKGKEATNALTIFSKGLSKSMKKLASAVKIKAIGDAVLKFGETIALIAGSIIALGLMYREDPNAFDYALKTVAGIGVVLVAITGLMGIAAKLDKKKGLNSVGKSVLMVATSLTLAVYAISKLMKIELPDDYGVKLAILGGILGGLGVLAILLGAAAKIADGNQLPKMSSTIKSLALLLVATVLSLKMLFNMELPPDYDVKLGILAGIFGGFALLLIAMAGAAKLADGNAFKAAGTILALAGFLVVVVGALFVLTLIPTDKMLKGALGLGGILLALGVALYSASKISDVNAYKSVLAMALMVGVITVALGVLSLIPFDKLLTSTIALGGVLLAMALNFKEVSKINNSKSLPVIVAMITATLAIAYALYELSMQPWEAMLASGAALSATILAFSKAFEIILKKNWSDKHVSKIVTFLFMTLAVIPIGAALNDLASQPWDSLLAAGASLSATILAFSKAFEIILKKNWSDKHVAKIGTFLLMTVAVIPIGASLSALASQPWDGLLAAGGAMSITIVAFSKAFQLILEKNWSDKHVAKIGTFLLMTLAVIPIGAALSALADEPWDGLIGAAVSLSITLEALAVCFRILSNVNVDLKAIGAVVAGSASLILIAYGISLLAEYDGDALLNSCLSISGMLVVMIGVMTACGLLSGLIPSAMVGVLGLGAVIAELALVLAALGAFAQIPGLKWLIDEGGDLLEAIGVAIGKLVGGLIGGVVSGFSSQLPQVGSDLAAFMTNLQPFIEGAKTLDNSALGSVAILSAVILALTAAEFVNGIASLFGLSLTDMAIELSSFMVALQPFLIGSRNIKSDVMSGIESLAKVILILTGANVLEGLTSWFTGGTSLTKFGAELAGFGPYFNKFYDSIKGVDSGVIQASANAAKAISEMASSLPNEGGLVSWFTGDNTLSQFADGLNEFGPKLKEYGENVDGLKVSAIKNSASAADSIAELAKKLPNKGGLVSWVTGDNTLDEFGEDLVSFGPNLKDYGEKVNGLKVNAIKNSATAADYIAELAKKLPNKGGLVSWVTGDNTLDEFGKDLADFGPNLKSYGDSVDGLKVSAIKNSASATDALVELAQKLPNEGGLVSWFTGDNDFKTFGESLTAFGNSLYSYYNSVSQIETGLLTTVIDEVGKLIDIAVGAGSIDTTGMVAFGYALKTMGENGIGEFIQAFTDANSRVTSAINDMMDNAAKAFSENEGPFKSAATVAAESAVTALIDGINAKKALAVSTAKGLSTAILNQFKLSLPRTTFNDIGQNNIVQGMINGINTKKPLMLSTITNICSSIISRFRLDLPTVTFKDFGINIINWLIQGMDSKKEAAKYTATQISNEVIQAFRNSFTVSSFIEIGANASLGLKYGIESKINEIAQAAIAAAKAAVEAAKKELEVASPSKKGERLGAFFSLGIAGGIIDRLKAIVEASKTAADGAIDPMKESLDDAINAIVTSDDLNMDPVIRPILDLSDVNNGIEKLGAMMDKTYDLSSVYERAMDTSMSFNRTSKTNAEGDGNMSNENEGAKYEFNQYNYSPRSLSRSEIYRQTNNQFSAFRRAVKPT